LGTRIVALELIKWRQVFSFAPRLQLAVHLFVVASSGSKAKRLRLSMAGKQAGHQHEKGGTYRSYYRLHDSTCLLKLRLIDALFIAVAADNQSFCRCSISQCEQDHRINAGSASTDESGHCAGNPDLWSAH